MNRPPVYNVILRFLCAVLLIGLAAGCGPNDRSVPSEQPNARPIRMAEHFPGLKMGSGRQPRVVNAHGAHLRDAPEGAIVDSLSYGDLLRIDSVEAEWAKVAGRKPAVWIAVHDLYFGNVPSIAQLDTMDRALMHARYFSEVGKFGYAEGEMTWERRIEEAKISFASGYQLLKLLLPKEERAVLPHDLPVQEMDLEPTYFDLEVLPATDQDGYVLNGYSFVFWWDGGVDTGTIIQSARGTTVSLRTSAD